MAASQRSKKLKGINDLRRACPFVTKQALSEVLHYVEEHGVPEAKSSKSMRRSAVADLKQWDDCAHGPMFLSESMLCQDGSSMAVCMVNLLTLLYAAVQMGGHFFERMQSAICVHGPSSLESPWSLAMCSDECLPANPLAANAGKKVWVTYVSFKEFGQQLLSKEDSWLPIFVQRSSSVAKIEGHMSQVIKHLLCSIFHGKVASPQHLGIMLDKPDGSKWRLFFTLGYFIQDGASQREIFTIKGDSGSKFCLKCSNQVAILLKDETDDEKAVCKATKKADLILTSNEECLQSWDRLHSRKSTTAAKDFSLWEQASGWTYTPHGILGCGLRRDYFEPCTMFVHDWMHATCSSGAMNIGLYCILEAFHMEDLQLWKVERHGKLYVRLALAPSNGKIKCQASDVLCIYTICRYYVQLFANRAPQLEKQILAFLALCLVLDTLCNIGKIQVLGRDLDQKVEACLKAFLETKWGHVMTKKFHWLLHMGDSLEELQQLIPCWCMERKHKQVTAVATKVTNLSHFEQSVYTELLGEQLHRMARTPLPEVGLAADSKPNNALANFVQKMFASKGPVYTSNFVILQGGARAFRNDVVLFKPEETSHAKRDCGHLQAPFKIDGQAFCLIQVYNFISYMPERFFATWTNQDRRIVVPVAEILSAVTYTCTKDGILTLIPSHLK
ncbi:unnamed protein product [Symbiodinium sp. CCMP2592]|nr:unnamed protein product [Symbiodinium sp. CCMP2592]